MILTDDRSAAIPAATLVIFRAAAGGGPPELLMVERAASLSFAAGALVFPGGRVDPGDRRLAADAADPDEAAHRIAAIRETLEEAGIAIGLSPAPDAAGVDRLRRALHDGASIDTVLAGARCGIAGDDLVAFARWRPAGLHRIFDTRFYLAECPPGAVAHVDGTENVRAIWTTAADALAAGRAGAARLIFPTRRNLERLARFADFAAAVADARTHPVTTITPWIERHEGRDQLCIPDGLGYPIVREPIETVERG